MNKVLQKVKIAEEAHLLKLRASEVASRAQQGQYVLLQTNPKTPLTPFLISDAEKDTISIVVPSKGDEGRRLAAVRKGSNVIIRGPLGRRIIRAEYGNIAIATDVQGVGAACWIGKSLRGGENKVFLIASMKGKPSSQFSRVMAESADKLFIVPDVPNKAGHPLVAELHNLMRRKHISLTFTLVNLPLSHKIARITHLRSRTFSFLTPILDDGIGMCGHCRVVFDGETRLACIEGPAMDAHKIDWESLLTRHGHAFDGEHATLDLAVSRTV